MSARHAEVWREGASFRLTDLASTNGTVHDGHELGRGDDVELVHGDVVEVGRTLLLFLGP